MLVCVYVSLMHVHRIPHSSHSIDSLSPLYSILCVSKQSPSYFFPHSILLTHPFFPHPNWIQSLPTGGLSGAYNYRAISQRLDAIKSRIATQFETGADISFFYECFYAYIIVLVCISLVCWLFYVLSIHA